MTEITCKKCKKRPVYQKRSNNYCFRCYETRRDANTRYRNAHKKENYERTKAWMKANPDKMREYRKNAKLNSARVLVARIANSEWGKSVDGKASKKRYYENHKKQIAEYAKNYVKINADKIRARIKKWSAENRSKVSEYVKKYRNTHPEQVTKSSRKRRETFRGVVGNFTLGEWTSLCDKFGNRCLWCGRTDEKISVDHVVPISKSGTNFIKNLQPLCLSCNSKKGSKIIDFRPFGSMILEWT